MKKLMITLIGVMVAATSLMAQEEPAKEMQEGRRHGAHRSQMDSEERSQQKADRLKEELNLTDEQASQLEQIHLKYAEQRKALHEAERGKREEHREQMKALSSKQREEMKAALTEEQVARMDELHEERMKKRQSRPAHRQRHGRG